MTEKKIYFPGLNGVRFFAAFLVIFHHTEQIKSIFQLPNNYSYPFVKIIGGVGVTLFFVLSGFLITYLLLSEKREFKRINFKAFYIRRILRIWPLYYLIVILAFFVLPYVFLIKGIESVLTHGFYHKLLLFIFLLPNVSLQFYSPVPFAAPLWSVGVEEQFYLIWPFVIQKLKKHLLTTLILFVIFIFIIKAFLFSVNSQYTINAFNFLENFRIDCMAIGGIYSYIYFIKCKKILNIIYNRISQVIVFSILIIWYRRLSRNSLVLPDGRTD